MDILTGIVLNLVAALIGVGIGWALRALVRWRQLRFARRFWGSFVDDGFVIVIPRYLPIDIGPHTDQITIASAHLLKHASGQHEHPEEQLGFVGAGEAIGLTELYAFFNQLGVAQPTVVFADALEGDKLQQNLLILGGPDSNDLTAEILRRGTATLRFSAPPEVAIEDTTTGTPCPIVRDDAANDVKTDYALLIRERGIFASDRTVIIAAGRYS